MKLFLKEDEILAVSLHFSVGICGWLIMVYFCDKKHVCINKPSKPTLCNVVVKEHVLFCVRNFFHNFYDTSTSQ